MTTKKQVAVQVRVTEAENKFLEDVAWRARLSKSEFVRQAIAEKAERDAKKRGEKS